MILPPCSRDPDSWHRHPDLSIFSLLPEPRLARFQMLTSTGVRKTDQKGEPFTSSLPHLPLHQSRQAQAGPGRSVCTAAPRLGRERVTSSILRVYSECLFPRRACALGPHGTLGGTTRTYLRLAVAKGKHLRLAIPPPTSQNRTKKSISHEGVDFLGDLESTQWQVFVTDGSEKSRPPPFVCWNVSFLS